MSGKTMNAAGNIGMHQSVRSLGLNFVQCSKDWNSTRRSLRVASSKCTSQVCHNCFCSTFNNFFVSGDTKVPEWSMRRCFEVIVKGETQIFVNVIGEGNKILNCTRTKPWWKRTQISPSGPIRPLSIKHFSKIIKHLFKRSLPKRKAW